MPLQTSDKSTKAAQTSMQKPLANCAAFASFSVRDLDQAREFYQNTLGVEVTEFQGMGFSMKCGDTSIFVYQKDNHVPATFTVLNFEVDDIEKSVAALKALSVNFETYGGDIETDANGIHREKGHQLAWFKDPSGNILSVIQEGTTH